MVGRDPVTDTDPTLRRAETALWRMAPDRVLALLQPRVPSDGGLVGTVLELTGDAALVWLALDEPATADGLVERLVEAGLDSTPERVGAALVLLADSGLVESGPVEAGGR